MDCHLYYLLLICSTVQYKVYEFRNKKVMKKIMQSLFIWNETYSSDFQLFLPEKNIIDTCDLFLFRNQLVYKVFFIQINVIFISFSPRNLNRKKNKNNTNQNDYLEYFNFPLLPFLKNFFLIQLELGNNDSVWRV